MKTIKIKKIINKLKVINMNIPTFNKITKISWIGSWLIFTLIIFYYGIKFPILRYNTITNLEIMLLVIGLIMFLILAVRGSITKNLNI